MSDIYWPTNNGQTARKNSYSERLIYKSIFFYIFYLSSSDSAPCFSFVFSTQKSVSMICKFFHQNIYIVSHNKYITDIFIHTISNNSLTTNLSEIRFLQIMDWYKNFCSTTVHIAHGMLLKIERFSKPIQSKV